MSKEELIDYIHAKQRETRIISQRQQEKNYQPRQKYYKLKKHINQFIENKEYYNRFIMMPGLRGVGKTTILYQLYQYLTKEKEIPEQNILYLDVDDLKSSYDSNVKEIFELYLEDTHQTTLASLDKKIFLFVDESQLDSNWAKNAKIIFDKNPNIFMIYTGSSALNLEVNTDATRRLTREQIFPCSFREYLLLQHNIKLSSNNFKDLILKGDEESIKKAMETEQTIKNELLQLDNDPEIEFKKYLHSQNFPFALNMDENTTHRLTNDVVKKIVYDDLRQFKKFNNITNPTILQILTYLATKKPGSTSTSTIAQSLQISSKTISTILQALEQTQLIFSLQAYGSSGVMLKKPLEHFFLAPSIKSSINYRVGRYDLNHEKCYSVLVENHIASTLKRIEEESLSSLGLFYDPDSKGPDFIVKHLERIIPIEVGIGKKTKSQLTIAQNKFKTKYAILISNRTKKIEYENNILYIPLLTFALL